MCFVQRAGFSVGKQRIGEFRPVQQIFRYGQALPGMLIIIAEEEIQPLPAVFHNERIGYKFVVPFAGGRDGKHRITGISFPMKQIRRCGQAGLLNPPFIGSFCIVEHIISSAFLYNTGFIQTACLPGCTVLPREYRFRQSVPLHQVFGITPVKESAQQ